MRKLAFAAAALAGLALSITAAEARSGIKVGGLSCRIAPGVGLIIASSKKIDCVYSPSGGGAREYYTGSINKIGVDIGITGKAVVAWAVFAPGKLNKGALAGDYVGASAQATAGLGIGANALIGGFKNNVGLQPISIQAQTGINIAAGIASLTLHHPRQSRTKKPPAQGVKAGKLQQRFPLARRGQSESS